MRHIQLEHNKWLRKRKIGNKVDLDTTGLSDATTLSFRYLGAPAERITVDATTRLTHFSDVRHLIVCHLEEDTDLALTILSDVLHALPTDAIIEFLGMSGEDPVIGREYFAACFERQKNVDGRRSYRKIAPCPAEEDDGGWTFCIPVGPGDATILNVVVKRILEIADLNTEILISGTPGNNFEYADRVRFVPERRESDAVAGQGINICQKKNILVEHATKSNVCVMHDRVYLPSDFMAAMKAFGPVYSIHALQSVYFDDYVNLAPVRYSDFNVVQNYSSLDLSVALAKDGQTLSAYASSSVWRIMKHGNFAFQHATRHNPLTYATGSLYIAKRKVWGAYPQDENIVWGECEDVEFGLRHNAAGIPHRVNPHTLSQSLLFRPMLIFQGKINCMTADGRTRMMKMPLAIRKSARRKPFYRKTHKEAIEALERLSEKYSGTADIVTAQASGDVTAMQWIETVMQVANRVSIKADPKIIREFLDDWSKVVHMDASNYAATEDYLRHIHFRGAIGLGEFLKDHYHFHCMLALRPQGDIFVIDPSDCLPTSSAMMKLGSLFSAFRLWTRRKSEIYLLGGPIAYYRAICNSTPSRTSV